MAAKAMTPSPMATAHVRVAKRCMLTSPFAPRLDDSLFPGCLEARHGGFASQAGCRPRPPGDTPVPVLFLRKKRRAARGPPLALLRSRSALNRVIHVELDGVGGHLEAFDLGHLELEVGVDHVVGEDAALLQEVAVLVEVVERLAQ